MRGVLLPIVAALLLLSACAPGGERPELDQTIREAVISAGDKGEVRFSDLGEFDWDSLYAFGAYATDDQVREAIGESWPSGAESRVPSDGLALVVFVHQGQVAAWSVLNETSSLPGAVRFDDTGVAIPADRARFRAVVRDQTTQGDPIYYLDLIE